MSLALALLGALRAAFRNRTDLALENLALRQQLALLGRRSKRPQFGRFDRAFWVWLSNRWAGWRRALYLVRPETVIRWHRQGFRAFWTWKSRRGRVGRPRIGSELADLVRTMALANPLWERHAFTANCSSSARRLAAQRRPAHAASPETALADVAHVPPNHLADLVAVDFFVVPTATFRVLCLFVVLLHHRRQVVHFNVHCPE